MKRINHPLHLLLTLCLSIVMCSCGSDVKKTMVLKLGHGLPPAHPVHLGLERMNDELRELSGGTMEMDIYPSAQLGSEIQCIELLQIGSLDITKVSAASLESFVEPFKIFGIPYIFRSRAHYDNVLNSEVGEAFLTCTEPYWFRGITYFDAGARSFYTTKVPIHKPEDLEGLKIRVQKSPIAVEMVNIFGGSATPVDWGELYTALQSNVVDGAENNTPSITTAFHHEVAKYYTVNEHTYSPDVIIIGSKTWAKLSEQQQRWLKEAAERGRVYETALWAEQEQISMEQIKANGVEVIYPDKKLFIDAAQPMIQKYKEDPTFTELINKIEAISDEK
ncbi:MAG: TRAP transporter substrate-binding protein [Rikenellaceae bacterium]